MRPMNTKNEAQPVDGAGDFPRESRHCSVCGNCRTAPCEREDCGLRPRAPTVPAADCFVVERQLTQEEAIAFHDSGAWEALSFRQRAEFQMSQEKLCMPFSVLHEAVSEALGRSVWTHEFAFADNLRAELFGDRVAPTFDEIMALIPQEKLIVVRAGQSVQDTAKG